MYGRGTEDAYGHHRSIIKASSKHHRSTIKALQTHNDFESNFHQKTSSKPSTPNPPDKFLQQTTAPPKKILFYSPTSMSKQKETPRTPVPLTSQTISNWYMQNFSATHPTQASILVPYKWMALGYRKPRTEKMVGIAGHLGLK